MCGMLGTTFLCDCFGSIHIITVSNDVRSAAVNRPLGVDFNVIKVGCIHIFFRTISISTKV